MKQLVAGLIAGMLIGQTSLHAGQNDAPPRPPVSLQAQLGSLLFFDKNLSSPPGQSCASCHHPAHAFADPDKQAPVSPGAVKGRFGNRNAPTAAYASFAPPLRHDDKENEWAGGLFLDGRADDLETQAKGPFLNPLEMANPDQQTVVDKVRGSHYAALFRKMYGQDALDDNGRAFDLIAQAIAAFERTAVFAQFSSKYDHYLAGRTKLSPQEARGLWLYEAKDKGNCAACHPSKPSSEAPRPLFTDFTYDNLGVPKNAANPFYRMPAQFNPAGKAYVDRGLGTHLGRASEDGKFKVPTLRNIALTAPYMHNGYFTTLRGVVEFYNSRDARPACRGPVAEAQAMRQRCWPAAEVAENVNKEELGNLRLTPQEVDDIVAFLHTLTDGYSPSDGKASVR